MRLVPIFAALLASACVQTGVTPVSRNEILISTSAAPICGGAGASKVASKMAAVETLRRGFARYIVTGAASADNTRMVAAPPTTAYTTAQMRSYGSSAYGSATTTYSGGGIMVAGTRDASLSVVMFNQGDAGYAEAVDAKATLGADWEKLVRDGIKTCG